MKKVFFFGSFILLSFCLISCSRFVSARSFDNISVHMKKEDVMNKMGKNGVARGSMINQSGQVIDLREYEVSTCNGIKTYWLYFYDGVLVKWGRAGDWKESEKKIYEINLDVNNSH